MLRQPLRHSGERSESGFTLIESVAAIAISASLLTAVAFATLGGLTGSAKARVNQQAGDVLESTIEAARADSFSDLVMYAADPSLSPSKDPRLLTSGCPGGGSMCVAIPSGSSRVKESLVTSSVVGFLPNHIQTVTNGTNKTPYQVATYVTRPSAAVSYVRVTVYVSWTAYGQPHTRVGSTYIADTRRGLPLPNFKLTCYLACAQYANPGGAPMFGFTVSNLGARDAFDLTSNNEALGWSYFVDNGNGTFDTDPSIDKPMTDVMGNGVRDTGLIDTAGSVLVWVTRTVPSDAVVGSVSTVTFTATSVAQPTLLPFAKKSQTTTLTIANQITPTQTPTATPSSTSTPASCAKTGDTGTTPSGTEYFLHNTAGGGATTAQYPLSMDGATPITTSLSDYSTNDGKGSGLGGLNLSPGTVSASASNPATVAAWQLTVSSVSKPTLSGTVYLDVWAEVDPTNPPPGNQIRMTALVGTGTNGSNPTWTDRSNGGRTLSASGCSGWQEFVFAIPVSSVQLSKNNKVEILLFNTGAGAIRVAYDTTAFPAHTWWTISTGSFGG